MSDVVYEYRRPWRLRDVVIIVAGYAIWLAWARPDAAQIVSLAFIFVAVEVISGFSTPRRVLIERDRVVLHYWLRPDRVFERRRSTVDVVKRWPFGPLRVRTDGDDRWYTAYIPRRHRDTLLDALRAAHYELYDEAHVGFES